jgi:hypothetical protein
MRQSPPARVEAKNVFPHFYRSVRFTLGKKISVPTWKLLIDEIRDLFNTHFERGVTLSSGERGKKVKKYTTVTKNKRQTDRQCLFGFERFSHFLIYIIPFRKLRTTPNLKSLRIKIF